MTMTLEQIIMQGGPLGFALLFAWLWFDARKKIEKVEGERDAARDKYTEFLLSVIAKGESND